MRFIPEHSSRRRPNSLRRFRAFGNEPASHHPFVKARQAAEACFAAVKECRQALAVVEEQYQRFIDEACRQVFASAAEMPEAALSEMPLAEVSPLEASLPEAPLPSCVAGHKPFPQALAKHSPTKKAANSLVVDMFETQGLGVLQDATVLILDTRDLTTTRALLNRHKHSIAQIVIVERNLDEYDAIVAALTKGKFGSRKVTAYFGDVFEYLAERTGEAADCDCWSGFNYDFVWLDLMMSSVAEHEQLLALAARNLRVRCLAVTLTLRGSNGDSYKERVDSLTGALKKVLPHHIADWGYQIAEGKTQAMQVAAFGQESTGACRRRVAQVGRLPPGDPRHETHSRIWWYGYPDSANVKRGTPDEWRERQNQLYWDTPRPAASDDAGRAPP